MKEIIIKILEEAKLEYKFVKNGQSIGMLCPFHNDKHMGNFNIDTSTGVFGCFACHSSGNISQLIFKLTGKHVDISEILDETDQFKNILRQEEDRFMKSQTRTDFMDLWKIHREYFIPAWESSEAMIYLTGPSRKLTIDTIKKFHLMYATEGRYAGRVIIPYSKDGRIIGFNGRLINCQNKRDRYRYELDSDSFQGFIYPTVKHNKYVILVEAPFSVHYMRQLGYEQTLSTLNTNVNVHHLKNLIEYDKFVFAFDNDPESKAGEIAAFKAIKLIHDTLENRETFIVYLPKKDPGECSPEELKIAFNTMKRVTVK